MKEYFNKLTLINILGYAFACVAVITGILSINKAGQSILNNFYGIKAFQNSIDQIFSLEWIRFSAYIADYSWGLYWLLSVMLVSIFFSAAAFQVLNWVQRKMNSLLSTR